MVWILVRLDLIGTIRIGLFVRGGITATCTKMMLIRCVFEESNGMETGEGSRNYWHTHRQRCMFLLARAESRRLFNKNDVYNNYLSRYRRFVYHHMAQLQPGTII